MNNLYIHLKFLIYEWDYQEYQKKIIHDDGRCANNAVMCPNVFIWVTWKFQMRVSFHILFYFYQYFSKIIQKNYKRINQIAGI